MQTIKTSDWLISENKKGDNKYWRLHILKLGVDFYTQTEWYQISVTGKKTKPLVSEPYFCAPTNVGRANERDSEVQAEFEYDSIIKKQRDKGYRSNGEKKQERPMPMLAHKFNDRKGRVTYPCFVQPKLDGMRMLFDGEVGFSRGNKEIIPEVIQHLTYSSVKKYETILDGELMLPGNVLLQESMKAIKKYRPELSPELEYWVYDIVDDGMRFADRNGIVEEMFGNDIWDTPPVKFRRVPTYVAQNEEEVIQYHNQFVDAGYEGTMIRSMHTTYEIGKRSYSLLKLKDFQDMEFKIIDVLEGSGSSKGLAIFKCITEDGEEFDSTPEATHEQRREWFTNRKKLIGKWSTVKFQDWTDDGKPTFNNTVAIRDEGEF